MLVHAMEAPAPRLAVFASRELAADRADDIGIFPQNHNP